MLPLAVARQSFLRRVPECDSGPLGDMAIGSSRDSSGLCASCSGREWMRAAQRSTSPPIDVSSLHLWMPVQASCSRLQAPCLATLQYRLLDRGHSRTAAVLHLLSRPRRLGSTSDYLIARPLSPHIITRGGGGGDGEEKNLASLPNYNTIQSKFSCPLLCALILPLDSHCRVDAPLSLGPASGPILIRPALLELPWSWTQKSTLVLPASRSTPSALSVLLAVSSRQLHLISLPVVSLYSQLTPLH
ncbi:hypothetical protein V8C26DRAFT_128365 [Trichoderma gracile]